MHTHTHICSYVTAWSFKWIVRSQVHVSTIKVGIVVDVWYKKQARRDNLGLSSSWLSKGQRTIGYIIDQLKSGRNIRIKPTGCWLTIRVLYRAVK